MELQTPIICQRQNRCHFSDKSTERSSKKLLWVHVASLGEYEQGRPVIKAFKRIHPEAQVLLSVFSPSAYQVIKSKKKADILVYLPIDTKQNAKRFIAAAKPTAVVFIKYEIWPNFLNEIDRNSIPSFLVSAIFRSSQIYFKRYGSFFRNTLKKFDHIFTQDEQSIQLLKNINYTSCSIGGDTRFDRVQRILATSNHLSYLDQFKKILNASFLEVLGQKMKPFISHT